MSNRVPSLPALQRQPRNSDDVPTKPSILRPATITVDDLEDAILEGSRSAQEREIDMLLVEYLLDLDLVV